MMGMLKEQAKELALADLLESLAAKFFQEIKKNHGCSSC
jgi:hypothetical protein